MYNTTLFQRWYRKWCVKYMTKYGTCFYSCFCTDYITYIYSSHVSVLTFFYSFHSLHFLFLYMLYCSCSLFLFIYNAVHSTLGLQRGCCTVSIRVAVLSTLPVSVDVAVLVPGCSGVQLNGGWLITIHSQHLQQRFILWECSNTQFNIHHISIDRKQNKANHQRYEIFNPFGCTHAPNGN